MRLFIYILTNYFDDFQNRFEFCHLFYSYQFLFEYNDFFFRRDRFRRIFHDNIFENEKKFFFFASSAARFSITTMRLSVLKIFRKKIAKTILNRERDVEKINNNVRKNFLITRALLRITWISKKNVFLLILLNFLWFFLFKIWFLIIATTTTTSKKLKKRD